MQLPSDAQWIRDYAAHGSDPAFAGIVARHTDLVYSAALRQTGSPELAREIAQSVFTDLARKAPELAGRLAPEDSLAGWLYRGTRFATLSRLRDERRRASHERQFMEHFHPAAGAAHSRAAEPAAESAPDWQQVAPVLDEAMAELGDADREAVVLRYFQNQDFQAVARALGVSEAAAQKRVSRAVERLRESLAQRGVTAGAQGLVVLIAAQAVLVAPAGLSAALATAALAGTTLITAATATVGKAIAMTTTQKVLIAVALAAAVGTGIYEARDASNLRAQVQTLKQQQQAPLAEFDQLRADKERAANSAQADADELVKLRDERAELLRLRGQVGVLRRQLAEATQRVAGLAGDTNDLAKRWAVGEMKPKGEWQDVGLGSPLAAVETFWWAAASKSTQKVKQCIAFSAWTNAAPVTDIYARREAADGASALYRYGGTGLRLLSQSFDNQNPDLAKVSVAIVGQVPQPDGTSFATSEPQNFELARIKDEWRILRDEHRVKLTVWDEEDSEEVAKQMLQMDPKDLERLRANPHLPARTLQAYEALKAKGAQ